MSVSQSVNHKIQLYVCCCFVVVSCIINRFMRCIHPYSSSGQCWKFPQVRRSEAGNFGGGLGTFCWFFFNFMFMIWYSRHEDLQLFWLSFKHCIMITSLALGQSYDCPSASEVILRAIGIINQWQTSGKLLDLYQTKRPVTTWKIQVLPVLQNFYRT